MSISSKKTGFWFVSAMLFVALTFSTAAHAETEILDNIATGYKSAAIGWTSVLLGFANRLFGLLATIEVAWSAITWALEKQNLESLLAAFLKKIIGIGIFYAILLNGPTWIPAIINSFVDAGSAASGVPAMSPSALFSIGLVNAATMLEGIKNLSLFDNALAIILCGLAAITIVLAFTVISGQLMVALIESYIVVSAGMLFLGFGGSRWTTDFVQKFIGYAVATGVKLFMLYLVVGIGTNQAQSWQAMLTTLTDPDAAVFNIVFTVMGGSIFLAFISWQIPGMAGAMLAGSPSLTAGAAASTAAVTGAGIVGAGAGAAAAGVGAAKSVGGLASAVSAGFNEAGAQGLSGLGRAVGTVANVGTAGMAVARDHSLNGVAATLGGQVASVSNARTAKLAESSAANSPAPAPAQGPQVSPPGGASATGTAGQAPAQGPQVSPPGGAATLTSAPGVQQQAPVKTAGLEDTLRQMQQVQPPQIPSDQAAGGTVHIKFDHPQD